MIPQNYGNNNLNASQSTRRELKVKDSDEMISDSIFSLIKLCRNAEYTNAVRESMEMKKWYKNVSFS